MNTYKKIIFASLLTFLLVGCSKDNFDPQLTGYITGERIEDLKKDPEQKAKLIDIELNGIYNSNANSTDAINFGIKSIDLRLDHMGLDLVMPSYHWLGYDYNFTAGLASDYYSNYYVWSFLYSQISSINTILKNYFPNGVSASTEQKEFQKYAELKSLRAIYYFYLVNIYQGTYKGNENNPGVPLLLVPTTEKFARSTVEEVYQQILSDFSVVDDARFQITTSKHDVDKAVALAYISKAYAQREEWSRVKQYAKILVDNGNITLTSAAEVASKDWDISSSAWLWGYDITNLTSGTWQSFYSYIDNTLPIGFAQYTPKAMFSLLYDKIGRNDIRKKLYINRALFSGIAAEYEMDDYSSLKYVTKKDATGDYCFIRKEDPYLLYVEALVELGELTEAKTKLTDLVKNYRNDTAYDISSLNQAQLREEVRTQRRIELWAEGSSFFDFKRWRMGADRTVTNSNHSNKINVPANDPRWIYQIPDDEMQNNTKMVQNNR